MFVTAAVLAALGVRKGSSAPPPPVAAFGSGLTDVVIDSRSVAALAAAVELQTVAIAGNTVAVRAMTEALTANLGLIREGIKAAEDLKRTLSRNTDTADEVKEIGERLSSEMRRNSDELIRSQGPRGR